MKAGILLGGCLAMSMLLQGCATAAALDAWKSHPVRREREVRFEGLGDGVRVVSAHLVGYRKQWTVERVWKLQGASLWLYESTADVPLRLGDDSAAVVGDLPSSPGWTSGSGETLEVLLVYPSTPIPRPALGDSGPARMVLRFDPPDRFAQRSVSAIVRRGERLVLVPVDWRGQKRFAPSSAARLIVVPALAVDILLSPLYLAGALLLLLSGPGAMR